jgi:hypothetical protein
MRNFYRYVVIGAMICVALLGLPILFPYNLKPHSDKSDHGKSALIIDA